MKYRLVVLTHGKSEVLADTLESFCEHVEPKPVDAYIHADGWEAVARAETVGKHFAQWPWQVGRSEHSEGFCEATRLAWKAAAGAPTTRTWQPSVHPDGPPEPTHVFWLEHDFVFTRPIDLDAMARVMAGQFAYSGNLVAQMALMRNAVNPVERSMGGLYELRKDDYRQEGVWLSHSSYFTTNPSLMTTSFMRSNPWPTYPAECEGRFGIDLVARGYRFGVWGDGSPYVEHVGERSGHGY